MELLVPPRNQMKCKKRILCVTTVIQVTRLLLWPHSSKERSMRLTGLGGSRLQCPHLSTHRAFKDRAPTQPTKKTVCHSAIVFAIDITVAIALATVIIPLPSRSVSASTSLCRGLVLHQGLMTSSVSLLGATQPPPYCSQHKTGTSQRCGLMGMRIEEEDTKKPMYIETIFACNTG